MKNKNDKRLIGAFEHIDDKFIKSAAKRIKPREAGIAEKGANKLKMVKQIAILAACLVLLGAAVPLAGRLVGLIPELFNPAGTEAITESDTLEATETEAPVLDDLPEEYFTNGWLFYGGTAGIGNEYHGKWIYTTTYSGGKMIVYYDPVTNKTGSICPHPASEKSCPAYIPQGWSMNYLEIIGDWCIFQISSGTKYDDETRAYNMKTGEARIVCEDVKNGNVITYPVTAFPMDDKLYLHMCDVDTSAETSRDYILCYDPATDTTEYLCDEPENLLFIGLSNKRLFFREKKSSLFDPSIIWTTDYSGGNLKKEEVLNSDLMIMSGIYAYDAVSLTKEKNKMQVYDLSTDSIFTIDFGGEAKSLILNEAKMIYTLKGEGKIYLGDLRGENINVLLDRPELDITLGRLLGDYLICKITDSSGVMAEGRYVLNIKTGEFTVIPEVNLQ